MQQFIRNISEGRNKNDQALTSTIFSSWQSPGGKIILKQALSTLLQNIWDGKSQQQSCIIILTRHSFRKFLDQVNKQYTSRISCIIDLQTDPHGWISYNEDFDQKIKVSQWRSIDIVQMRGYNGKELFETTMGAIEKLSNNLNDENNNKNQSQIQDKEKQLLVFLDSVNNLNYNIGWNEVIKLVYALKTYSNTSAILMGCNQETIRKEQASTIENLSNQYVTFRVPAPLVQDVLKNTQKLSCCAEVQFMHKRPNGKAKVDKSCLSISNNGILQWLPSPNKSMLGKAQEALIQMHVHGQEDLDIPQQQKSKQQQDKQGIKHDLSEQEKQARSNVVLPFEHQGKHGQFSNEDFRTYLPKHAGGYGNSKDVNQVQGEGHITYLRDSENDYDSDEDPDDDILI